MDYRHVMETDPELFKAIADEVQRQREHIELIASENFVSPAVMEAMGSPLTNKYAEGYPAKRYYGGCQYVDVAENLARDRAKLLFGAEHANVQPHSGAQANTAVYFAMLNPGDTVLGMNLSHGGHLTHGSPVNISGKYFHFIPYGVDETTGRIDYDAVRALALENKPRMIVAGASAYPRAIDFARLREIADEAGALLMVDMAIDKAIFPGTQGGPLMHVIAAKAVCFLEALRPEFKAYQRQIIANAKALENAFRQNGIRMVSDGTDNHLILMDLTGTGRTGKEMETLLGQCNITVNKNTIPGETLSPMITSGVRVGTPAVTTRGMVESDMEQIAGFIRRVLEGGENACPGVKSDVMEMMKRFPLYEGFPNA